MAAAITGAALLLGRSSWPVRSHRPPPPAVPVSQSPVDFVGPPVKPGPGPRTASRQYSPLAAELLDPATPPEAEVRLVQQLFSQYRSALQNRSGPPVGDNQDLVKVLTGRNPLKRPLLPPGYPRIDPKGRLLDRWGNPFHIHAISSRWIEVRSAGSDGRLFDADDVVTGAGYTTPSREGENESPPEPGR